MYQGTMVEELIEMVMRAEERAQSARLIDPLEMQSDGFVYGLPQAQAVLAGVA